MHDIRIMVLNFKRPSNVHKIINTYKDFFPITVINNNSDDPFPYVGQPVDVINNEKNFYCMERWVRSYEYPEPYKLIIDDDILIDLQSIIRMRKKRQTIVGIYGKTNVSKASSYEDLGDNWCVDADNDFLVGSAIMVRQDKLDMIKSQVDKVGYPVRGDDIIISYLLKKYCRCSTKTVSAKVLNLPEGSVGLNKDPKHFSMRWKVIEKFKNLTW